MTAILLVVLFISQLLTFYFLAILNSKLSKYKAIEKKQEAIIREMDDAISAYLLEVKDENDRLIKELTMQSKLKKTVGNKSQGSTETRRPLEEDNYEISSKDVIIEEEPKLQQLTIENKESHSERVIDIPKIVPKTIAATAYKKQLPNTQQVKSNEQFEHITLPQQNSISIDQSLSPFELEVVGYHRLGMSIEEIAKKTQKGKKEIELLIKFHA